MQNGKSVAAKVKNFVLNYYPRDYVHLQEVGWDKCPISFKTARHWRLLSETVGQLSTRGKNIQKRNGNRYKEPLVKFIPINIPRGEGVCLKGPHIFK